MALSSFPDSGKQVLQPGTRAQWALTGGGGRGPVEAVCGFSREVPASSHIWKLPFYLCSSEPVTGTRKGAGHCAGQCWAPEPDWSHFLKDHPSPAPTLPPHLRRETSMFTTSSTIK